MKYPAGAQGLNRYSYVDNNPLSRVDPSGYGWLSKLWKKIKRSVKKLFKNDVFRAVVGIGLGILTTGYLNGLWIPFGKAAASAAGGFVGGFVASGGSLRMGAIGALTALTFYGVGDLAKHGRWGPGRRALAHGLVGGGSSAAQGGKFKHGMLSAGFTSAASPVIGTLSNKTVGRTLSAALIGGTAAELGGGKFANGAVTGAFSRLFNDEGHQKQKLYSNDEMVTKRYDMNPTRVISNDRATVFGKIIGLAADVVGLLKPSASFESGTGYFEKIDTIEIQRQWYDATTQSPLGRERISQPYQAKDMSGTYVEGYTHEGNGVYTRPVTIINGAPFYFIHQQ